MNWVGRRLPRYEDPVLLRGDGRFVADLARGALAMRFVRSPVARGTIRDKIGICEIRDAKIAPPEWIERMLLVEDLGIECHGLRLPRRGRQECKAQETNGITVYECREIRLPSDVGAGSEVRGGPLRCRQSEGCRYRPRGCCI